MEIARKMAVFSFLEDYVTRRRANVLVNQVSRALYALYVPKSITVTIVVLVIVTRMERYTDRMIVIKLLVIANARYRFKKKIERSIAMFENFRQIPKEGPVMNAKTGRFR